MIWCYHEFEDLRKNKQETLNFLKNAVNEAGSCVDAF